MDRIVQWNNFMLAFDAEGEFLSYSYGMTLGVVPGPAPDTSADLWFTTPRGIGIGSSYEEVVAAYPNALPICSFGQPFMEVTDPSWSFGYLFQLDHVPAGVPGPQDCPPFEGMKVAAISGWPAELMPSWTP